MTAHATLHGSVTDTGGENCDERGFDWDYDSGAPYAGSWTQSNSYGVGPFSHEVTGLNEGVTLYFRAKAHNSAGWGYGGELSFTTAEAFSKTLTELLGLLDTHGEVKGLYKTFTELLGLLDITVKKDASLIKDESLGLLDTFDRTWVAYKVNTELLGLSDTVVKSIDLHNLTESLGLLDTTFKSASIIKAEILGLTDTFDRVWAAHKTFTELLGLKDTIKKDATLPLTDLLGLKDTVKKSSSIIKDELLGLKDLVVKDVSVIRTELLGLLDTIKKDISLPLPELLGLKDTTTKATTVTKVESLGLKDLVSKQVSLHALTEILGLLDSISYSLNPTVLAKLIRKYIQLENIGGGKYN